MSEIQTQTFKGARYVPYFPDPIEWSSDRAYEAITAVQHNAFTYLSKKPVPEGVEITNTDFWLLWADPNAQMEQLREEVERYGDKKAYVFETVADMKANENLSAGSICHTNGFHVSDDGGAAWYIISDTGTANEMDVIECSNLFANLIVGESTNVNQFGANTSNFDNYEQIQRAIEICQNGNKKLIFAKGGNYTVSNKISITAGIDIDGNRAFINGNSDDNVLEINMPNEIRNRTIKNLGIRNYGNGNAFEIIDNNNSFVSCLISECSFYAVQGWCMVVHEYFSHSKIELSTFAGKGISFECGDANIIEKCLFHTGNIGIYLNTPSYGELSNAIINNTIVNPGWGILIDSGDNTLIENNQIEYGGSADSSNNPSCMVYLRGTTRTIYNCAIINNNFGGGTHLKYCLYINAGIENIISGNRFVATNECEVYVANGGNPASSNNYYYQNNYCVSTPSNPRTDVYQRTKVKSAVARNICGNIYELTLPNAVAPDNILRICKTDNGEIIFYPCHAVFDNATGIIATLPEPFRPVVTIYREFNSSRSGNSELIRIKYNGEMELVDQTTPLTTTDFTISGFATKKF